MNGFPDGRLPFDGGLRYILGQLWTCLLLLVWTGKIDQKLIGICSFSDDQMSKKSLMGHLVIDGESGCFTKFFKMVEYFICFIRNKGTSIYVYNFTKFSLFVEADAPVRKNGNFLFFPIIQNLHTSILHRIRDIFSETKFYFIPISFLQWRTNDR